MRRPTAFTLAFVVLLLPRLAGAQRRASDEDRFRTSGIEVTVRFRDDRVKPLGSQIQEVLEGGLAHYHRVFGAPPRATDGSPLVRLTVNVGIDRAGGGETSPGVVSLLVTREPAHGFYDWKLALLHETMHLWNTASFRHGSTSEAWFAEGAAEFYAMQAAARMDLLDDTSAVRVASTAARLYQDAMARAPVTPMQAGANLTANHAVVHFGGWMTTLMMDRLIRERTGNTRSMDDVMRWLLANHDRDTKAYRTVDIARAMREATGQDLTELFARHVMGRLPVPAAALLAAEDDSLLGHSLGVLPD